MLVGAMILVCCGVMVVLALVAYILISYTIRPVVGQRERQEATVPDPHTPALIAANRQESDVQSTQVAPLDAWVDDDLRRKLDSL